MAITNKIYAPTTVSMTDLRRARINDIVSDAPVAILNHNKAAAYLLSADYYEYLLDQLENVDLSKIVKERRGGKTVKVALEDL
jgi:antitoxin StbD